MKTFARIASVLVLSAGVTGLSFASGSQESYAVGITSHSITDVKQVGEPVAVAVPQAVRDWFQAHGVDGTKLDAPLTSLTVDYKDDVEDLIADTDNREELDAIITPVLKSVLVRNQVESSFMRVGRHVWSAAIYGPEDSATDTNY